MADFSPQGENQLKLENMIRNYLKIAWRILHQQKMYSAIKIGGFSLGISACILIALFIQDELSYDKHYTNGDSIYRVVISFNDPGNTWKGVSLPAPIKEVLESDFPEVEKAGRLIVFDWFDNGNNQFRPADKIQNSYEEAFVYADPEMLEMLEIPMVYGERSKALSEPNTIVISKRKSEKYFPNQNPVGQTIILNENNSNPYKIGGVMENFPTNSHLQYDFLLTLKEKEFWPGSQSGWNVNVYQSYVKLKQGSDPIDLEKKLLSIRDNHIVATLEKEGNKWAEEAKKYLSFQLQPIKDIYLRSDIIVDDLAHGDIKIVWLFGVIAGFILIMACINFINLSTAKSANRAKEIGLRKVVGSQRIGLIGQFMTESLVFSLISFVIGVLLAWILLPYFNLLSDKTLVFPWFALWLLPVFIISVSITGIMAGLYPSIYLSAFRPIEVLKGSFSKGNKSSKLRSGMVVFQFTTSIVLIICTYITYNQMEFILNTKIGYDKEQVVLIQGANTLGEKSYTFKNELLQLSEVSNVTQNDYLPILGTKRDGRQFWKDGRSKIDKGVGGQYWRVDEDYINTLGIKLLNGRNFSSEMATDSSAIIINQKMANELGLNNPIGERIMMSWGSYDVIGVVENFHFESMKGDVTPLAMLLADHTGSIVSIKLESENMVRTLESISNLWNQFMPNQPIRYTFLDDAYAKMYSDIRRTGDIFTAFAMLAIIVACLGLFGLSAFMVEQRNKEISIRKVLGASFVNIFNLLTFNFLKLVLIALFVAIPIGWYIMNKWLQDYANRIEITWVAFVIAGIIAVLIALISISSESLKAAIANPVKSLRSD